MQSTLPVGTIQVLPSTQPRPLSFRTVAVQRVLLLAGLLTAVLLLGAVVVSVPAYPWGRAVPGFLAVAGESFIPLLPLGPLVALNVILLGAWDGFVVSWLGALAGSSGAYWLVRLLGRAWIMQRLPASCRARVDALAARTSFGGLLLAWLIPGVNCAVAYAAGVGGVGYGRFLASCALGLLPWVALYAALAHDLASAGFYGLGLAALALLLFALRLARRLLPHLLPS